MNTRFDNAKSWKTADGRVIEIKEMETSHIMNTLRLFVRKPHLIMSMIVKDFDEIPDNQPEQTYGPWNPKHNVSAPNFKAESMYAVTSLTNDDLVSYAVDSALGRAMRDELASRGINVENLFNIWKEEVELSEG